MKYETPRALEQAVKAAAKKSPYDTNKTLKGFYFDRFLCRVFSEERPAFVLKGGQSMLARIPDTRATRDIDLLFHEHDIEEAVEALKRVAAIDLGDFILFRFEGSRPIAQTQEYRTGVNLTFIPLLGAKAQQSISVDLVVDQIECENPDVVKPINRLEIAGLPVSSYLVYPIINCIADKICAISQPRSDGRVSSRVKDLVDLVVILKTQTFEATPLLKQIDLEHALRKMGSFEGFTVPKCWYKPPYSQQYRTLCSESPIALGYSSVELAEELVRTCVDNIVVNSHASWNFERLVWA